MLEMCMIVCSGRLVLRFKILNHLKDDHHGHEYCLGEFFLLTCYICCSYKVRISIESHGAVDPLVYILKEDVFSNNLKEKVVTILARLSQTGEEVKVMIKS